MKHPQQLINEDPTRPPSVTIVRYYSRGLIKAHLWSRGTLSQWCRSAMVATAVHSKWSHGISARSMAYRAKLYAHYHTEPDVYTITTDADGRVHRAVYSNQPEIDALMAGATMVCDYWATWRKRPFMHNYPELYSKHHWIWDMFVDAEARGLHKHRPPKPIPHRGRYPRKGVCLIKPMPPASGIRVISDDVWP